MALAFLEKVYKYILLFSQNKLCIFFYTALIILRCSKLRPEFMFGKMLKSKMFLYLYISARVPYNKLQTNFVCIETN